jgi:hypothetical protein
MKEIKEKLMRTKSITKWIEYCDRWISDLRERFFRGGTPIPHCLLPELSALAQHVYDIGVRDWARHAEATEIKLPEGLATIPGAQATIAHVQGLRAGAEAELQALMDELENCLHESYADDKMRRAIGRCLIKIETNNSACAQAKT